MKLDDIREITKNHKLRICKVYWRQIPTDNMMIGQEWSFVKDVWHKLVWCKWTIWYGQLLNIKMCLGFALIICQRNIQQFYK